jgi:hypothetical protein
VTMPSADSDDAHICCLRIAFDLHTSLLGECRLADLHIARLIPGDGDAIIMESIAEPGLSKLAERAGLKDQLQPPQTTTDGRKEPVERVVVPARTPPKFVHRFAPFWDVRKEAVATWRCLTHNANQPAGMTEDARDRLALALACIGNAMAVLARRLKQNDRFLLSIPISHELLSSPLARMEIASTCRSLPGEVRPYLLFEITDLPPGVPQSRMNDLITVLRPFAKAVMVQVPLHNPSFAAYQGLGVHAVGVGLGSPLPHSEACNEIERLCSNARVLHAMPFLIDVSSADILREARQAGVNLVSGPIIGSPVADPQPMRHLYTDEILNRAALRMVGT